MTRKTTWLGALALSLVIEIGSGAQARPGPADEQLFRSRCASCHGVDGRADTPAGKAVGATSWEHNSKLQGMSDAQIANLIRTGVKKDGVVKMPPVTDLTNEQIQGLVAYVRSLEKR
jgi:mono/diheme cytochrome c family protein